MLSSTYLLSIVSRTRPESAEEKKLNGQFEPSSQEDGRESPCRKPAASGAINRPVFETLSVHTIICTLVRSEPQLATIVVMEATFNVRFNI